MGILGQLHGVVLDAVFPRYCLWCKEEGALLCERCFSLWTPRLVESMQVESGGDMRLASFVYADPLVNQLIQNWKYHFDDQAWELLHRKLVLHWPILKEIVHSHRLEAVVPLSLHRIRHCERGFDQAEILANALADYLQMPMSPYLRRDRETGKQADRSTAERKKEMVETPFIARGYLEGARLLLVDDVWTTGATMEAAARALKEAGAEKVVCYTIARG